MLRERILIWVAETLPEDDFSRLALCRPFLAFHHRGHGEVFTEVHRDLMLMVIDGCGFYAGLFWLFTTEDTERFSQRYTEI